MSTAIRRHPIRTEKARITRPKPGKTRPRRRVRQRMPGQYNPRIASRGLTVDTALGPVDTIAIERALAGRPVTLTEAEREVLITRLAMSELPGRWEQDVLRLADVAAAIGANPERLRKNVHARRAQLRAQAAREAEAARRSREEAGHG